MLQACILVALYEVERLNCHRAVASIGIISWLVKQLRLHSIDSPPATKRLTHCQNELKPTDDRVEVEERRRTFWVAYCIESFASALNSYSVPLDHVEVSSDYVLHERCTSDKHVDTNLCTIFESTERDNDNALWPFVEIG